MGGGGEEGRTAHRGGPGGRVEERGQRVRAGLRLRETDGKNSGNRLEAATSRGSLERSCKSRHGRNNPRRPSGAKGAVGVEK